MKAVVLLFAVSAVMLAQMAAAQDQLDKVNIDEVLHNDRLLNNYFGCLLGKKSCTAEGRLLKERLPEAISTGCAKCTDNQKERLLKIIRYVKNNKPDMWKELTAKYDPTGEHLKEHHDKL